MSIEPTKVVERSVDSIQRIYAVVIALAISQSIQSLVKDPSGLTNLDLYRLWPGLPPFIAFLATLVPFWHGMNRHLDRCYLEKQGGVVQGALLLDFATFFAEAIFLFAAGWSLRSGIDTYKYIGGLLCVDMIWAFISHQIHFQGKKSHAVSWAVINVVAIVIAVLIVAYPFAGKPLLLMMVAVLRSIADYGFGWGFYFPNPHPQPAKT